MTEVYQLCKRNCLEPILFKDLTSSGRRKYCDDIMLLTEKNNGDVKGRDMINGKQLRVWKAKDDTSRPTALDEIIIIAQFIYAK